MSYLVMECRRSYAVLLDQEGRFVKAANLRYEVGQTVFDPVLLEEPAPKLKLLPWIGGTAARPRRGGSVWASWRATFKKTRCGRSRPRWGWPRWPQPWCLPSFCPCTTRRWMCTPPST